METLYDDWHYKNRRAHRMGQRALHSVCCAVCTVNTDTVDDRLANNRLTVQGSATHGILQTQDQKLGHHKTHIHSEHCSLWTTVQHCQQTMPCDYCSSNLDMNWVNIKAICIISKGAQISEQCTPPLFIFGGCSFVASRPAEEQKKPAHKAPLAQIGNGNRLDVLVNWHCVLHFSVKSSWSCCKTQLEECWILSIKAELNIFREPSDNRKSTKP